jgi:hypothetical protein
MSIGDDAWHPSMVRHYLILFQQLPNYQARKTMLVRSLPVLLLVAVLWSVAGCEQQSDLVYVLEEPQSVTLIASASTLKGQQGESIVLHVERRTSGKWKQIPLSEVRSGQCWVYRPPVESEPEVADSLQWEVVPENAVTFNREYRLDHKRIATANIKGTIKLTPFSAVKCEADRAVRGPSVLIEVS